MSSVANLCCPVVQFGDIETTHGVCHEERHLQPLNYSSCEAKGRQNTPIGFRGSSHNGSGDILNTGSSEMLTNSPVVTWQSKQLTWYQR